jgi:nucleoside-diphosphate-sugar epimerase
MRVLLVGCGYVGLSLGRELADQGHEVFGVRRSEAAAETLQSAGIKPLVADITQPAQLSDLPGPFDWVVNLVSSNHGGVAEYRQVYLAGMKNLVRALAATPPKKLVYTSSTSVYGQTDGSQVKESSPTEPGTETAQVLLEAEGVLLQAFQENRFPAVVLRVAGIYGPDRGHPFKQFLKNEVRIQGKGERFMNMIHLADLTRIIAASLRNGRPGEIYNAVDDEPVMQIHFFRWLSETLGKWMPAFEPEPDLDLRKRGLTNKKVSNRKLKMELGYQFKYPTFRQGYTAEIQRLDQAGLLNIEPEPR